MLREIYQHLPESIRPVAKKSYYWWTGKHEGLSEEFVRDVFGSVSRFEELINDNTVGEMRDRMEWATTEYEEATNRRGLSAVDLNGQIAYYAIVKALNPDIVVETGVANGASTYALLAGLEEQSNGRLISIDMPFREGDHHGVDSEDAQLRFLKDDVHIERDSVDGETSIYLPEGFEPGWIVPEGLRNRWNLRIGRSQRELPLVLSGVEEIDVFIHDSDHSIPCQLFEYELAWEWLRTGGILLSDDIGEAFNIFSDIRPVSSSGKVTDNIGYMIKGN